MQQEDAKGVASLQGIVRLFCLGTVIWFCLQMVLKQQTHHSRFKISNLPTDYWLDPNLLHRRQFHLVLYTWPKACSPGGHIAFDRKFLLLFAKWTCGFCLLFLPHFEHFSQFSSQHYHQLFMEFSSFSSGLMVSSYSEVLRCKLHQM